MNDASHLAERCRRLDQGPDGLTRGDIDGRGADGEAGLVEDFGAGGRIFRAKIGQKDMLARADPARDRLADGASADDDNDALHDLTLA